MKGNQNTPNKVCFGYIVFYILCCIAFLSSCSSPRFYTPNRNVVPLFNKKGDVYLDLSSNCVNKGDFTVGLALTNNLAAYAGYGLSKENNNGALGIGPEIRNSSIGRIQNYGLGFFLNEVNSSRLYCEVFADVVLGKYEITKSWTSYTTIQPDYHSISMTGHYNKLGILFNVAREPVNYKKFRCGYTLRVSKVEFYGENRDSPESFKDEIYRLNRKDYYTTFEYGLFGKLRSKALALQFQCAFYHALYSSSENHAVQQFNASFMLGLCINTNVLRRNRY